MSKIINVAGMKYSLLELEHEYKNRRVILFKYRKVYVLQKSKKSGFSVSEKIDLRKSKDKLPWSKKGRHYWLTIRSANDILKCDYFFE